MVRCQCTADPPTHPYLIILVRKSAGNMDVRPYFSKYGHIVSRKYRNRDLNKCELVASEADRRVLMGSYCSLTFAYFKPFPGLKYTAGPDMPDKFIEPMNIDFASKLLEVSHLPIMNGGFEFKAVGDKWLHKTDEEEECTNQGKIL